MHKRKIETITCSSCGHVFDIGTETTSQAQSDHPVRGGGPVYGAANAALGVATIVTTKGLGADPTADELPSYVCPQCGHIN